MTSELRVDRIVPVDGVPSDGGGGIVQVKHAFKTDTQSHNTATRVDISGLSVVITPKFSTSKLLITGMVAIGHAPDTCCNIFINVNGSLVGGSNSSNGGNQSSQPQDVHTGIGYNYVTNYEKYRVIPAPVNSLFSPNSTSAQTIKLQMSQTDTTNQYMYVNRSDSDNNATWVNRQTSALTVFEVSA